MLAYSGPIPSQPQAQIVDAGALASLVRHVRAHKPMAITRIVPGSGGIARRAADTITNLAHENGDVKVGRSKPDKGGDCP
jgi:hypothetical protein